VISGPIYIVEKVRDAAIKKGAKKGVMLAVSGPFHSPWMAVASEKLSATLRDIRIADLNIQLIANYTAQAVLSASEIKEILPKQITGTVRWRESVGVMLAQGADSFWEIGHGTVLAGITRRCAPEASVFSVQTADDVVRNDL
jgi:[acyl-carrier-protein] S-malonyltransferase